MRLPTPRFFQAHKRPLLFAALLLAAATNAPAQFFGAAAEIKYVTADLTGACLPRFITVNTLTANVRGCINLVWTDLVAGGSGSGLGVAFTTVAYSATPTYTVTASTSIQTFKITLTGNITSATLATTSATVGQTIIWQVCQDVAGNHTITWPASVVNYGTLDPTASSCSKQAFIWDGTTAVPSSVMYSDAATPALLVSTGALILPTAPDSILGLSSHVDVDGTLAANSDTKIPSQKAIRTYVAANAGGSMTKISRVSTSAASSITFSVPAGYTTLKLECQTRTTAAAGNESLFIKFNSDATAANYSSSQWESIEANSYGNGTVAATTSGAYAFSTAAANSPANLNGTVTLTLPEYSGTTFYKAFRSEAHYRSTTGVTLLRAAGYWFSTAAITNILITTSTGGNFANGSACTLYGLQ